MFHSVFMLPFKKFHSRIGFLKSVKLNKISSLLIGQGSVLKTVCRLVLMIFLFLMAKPQFKFIRVHRELRDVALVMGSTITGLTIGLGPNGELRYPSHHDDTKNGVGAGEFQCYDESMMRNLKQHAENVGFLVHMMLQSLTRIRWSTPSLIRWIMGDSICQFLSFMVFQPTRISRRPNPIISRIVI